MSRVRKDILNGWKEIGGYVCRDIRTVERWEKQRGLPVRRVPGAGRSTVYALIPELDEWLARNRTSELEVAGLRQGVAAGSMETAAVSRVGDSLPPEECPQTSGLEDLISPKESLAGEAVSVAGRLRRLGTASTAAAAAAAVMLCAVMWPVLAEARRGAHDSRNAAEPAHAAAVSYASRVPGVEDLYLRGVYFYEQRTPDSLQRSEQNFRTAIAKDASYAPAYAGLSNAYNLQREYSRMSDAEAYPKAKAAAERALELNPALPEAHASLGFIDFFWSMDAAGAEREFKRALELDPNAVLARHWYGSVLAHEGRYAEANQQLALAQRLQPTSSAILSTHALAIGLGGRRDEAVEMLEEVLHNAPAATSPHNVLSILSLVQPRDPARYLDELRKIAQIRQDEETLRWIAVAQAGLRSGGETGMWRSILQCEERLHTDPARRTFRMAEAEMALGETEQAIADLQQLTRRRDRALVGLALDPNFAPIRQDPRYRDLLQSLGIPAPASEVADRR